MADLSNELNSIIMTALRSGVPLDVAIATLQKQADMLRLAAPIVAAVSNAGWSQT